MFNVNNIQVHPSWKTILNEEFKKPYFSQIIKFLEEENKSGNMVYPKWLDIFNSFNQTSFDDVKVVVLWQDPYHGQGEAHWLCFSVNDWIKIPPSLRNIFKELITDIPGFVRPVSGSLVSWAKQWVLLLNATLTVRKDTPNSHKKAGWQQFTDEIIKKLSEEKDWLVFLLWWAFAQSKIELIDQNNHLILQTSHPSPFSASKGFLWSKHFSKTNDYLISCWKTPIDWKLSQNVSNSLF